MDKCSFVPARKRNVVAARLFLPGNLYVEINWSAAAIATRPSALGMSDPIMDH